MELSSQLLILGGRSNVTFPFKWRMVAIADIATETGEFVSFIDRLVKLKDRSNVEGETGVRGLARAAKRETPKTGFG